MLPEKVNQLLKIGGNLQLKNGFPNDSLLPVSFNFKSKLRHLKMKWHLKMTNSVFETFRDIYSICIKPVCETFVNQDLSICLVFLDIH